MFLVKLIDDYGEVVIHQPDNGNTKVQTGSIKRSINGIDSFEFSILPNSPGYDRVQPLITRVTVTRVDKNKLIFDGRVLKPKTDMNASSSITRTFTCEGFPAYLHDVVPRYRTLTGSYSQIIGQLLDEYNGQVEEWKKIVAGDITTAGNLSLECTPETDMYDTIYKFAVTDHSLELKGRTDLSGKHFLDIGSQLGEVKSEPAIKLAHNLQSMSVETDPTSVISRVIPLGASKQDSSSTTQKRISLEDIGKTLYVDSQELIKKFGIQSGVQIYDSVTDANQLTGLANSYLTGERPETTKYTVTALDLSTIELDVDDFDAYNSYPVINPVMHVDETLRVSDTTINIVQPETAALTIGNKMKRGTDYAADAERSAKENKQVNQKLVSLAEQATLMKENQDKLAEKVQAVADQAMASVAQPTVKLSVMGQVITYTITEARNVEGASYTAEISADQNTWTAADTIEALTGTLTINGQANVYYVRVKASIGDYDSPFSPVAMISV